MMKNLQLLEQFLYFFNLLLTIASKFTHLLFIFFFILIFKDAALIIQHHALILFIVFVIY